MPREFPKLGCGFWFNAVGILAVVLLLGAFFTMNGTQLVPFLKDLFGPHPSIPQPQQGRN